MRMNVRWEPIPAMNTPLAPTRPETSPAHVTRATWAMGFLAPVLGVSTNMAL